MFLCKQTVNRGMNHIWRLELPGCIHAQHCQIKRSMVVEMTHEMRDNHVTTATTQCYYKWMIMATDRCPKWAAVPTASLLWSHHIILITPSTGNLHWLKHPLLTITHCHSHKTVDSASRMCQPTPFEMTPKPLPQWHFRGSAWQISPCACKAATWAELARFACSVCEGVSWQTSSCLLATESLGRCLEAASNKHAQAAVVNEHVVDINNYCDTYFDALLVTFSTN